MTRREFSALTVAGLAASRWPLRAGTPLTPDVVHRELIDGNKRFLSGQARHPHSSLDWAKRAGKEGQHPHAVILCCSDSRVSPEIIFDQGIGDLFVVRVAGNVAHDDEIGSIEYAVEHLSVPLCVVLGHTGCGAVAAVLAAEKEPVEIEHLVAPVQKAYAKAKQANPRASQAQLAAVTTRWNVLQTCADIAASAFMKEQMKRNKVRIEGALYDLNSARVEWLALPSR